MDSGGSFWENSEQRPGEREVTQQDSFASSAPESRNRKLLLRLAVASVVASFLAISCPAGSSLSTFRPARVYRLRLYETHRQQRIDIVYRRGDHYIPAAIAQLDYFLRDHLNGSVPHYDPRVFNLLVRLATAVGKPNGEIDVICGYRSPATNHFLRVHSAGVAQHSLHMKAEAIDIRMPGVNTEFLRETALELHRGGVGYYPHSDFVHVDVGRVRRWCFECSTKQIAGN
jgi:uncharacterized protein YcbK (DUF882 family)